MPQSWWPSPAKLNLFLHITGRNATGYHELQTLFQMLDTGDRLAFDINDNGIIAMSESLPGVPDEDNLVIKAARLLARHTGSKQGATIYIDKQLPMGGGIGGGSSNAATTLVALNHLWNCQLSEDELAHIGLQLGADVPVFIHGKTVFAEGVGEKFSPVSVPAAWYLIVNPGVHVSTPAIFGEPDLPRQTPRLQWSDYRYESTRNDCQEIVCKRHPEVAKLLQWLVHYAPSRMTGTGACVFATFSDQQEARDVLAKLPADWTGFVAKGVAESPLQLKRQEVNTAPDNM